MDAIAAAAGVSKTTVHRALRNASRISPATRQRILDVASRMGYRPNRLAQSLRARRSGTFGVVVLGITGSFYANVLDGLESAAQERKHSILLACSHEQPQREKELIELFLEKQVDGIIVAPADPEENRDYFLRLIKERVRIVFIDRYMPGLDIPCVSTNNELGGYLAGKHLVSLGREKICFLTSGAREHKSTSVQDRLRGCNRALQEAGLPPAKIAGPNPPGTPTHEQTAYHAMMHFLMEGGELDGLFAVNDECAYRGIKALLDFGLRVPKDVSVVGFDDQLVSAYFTPPLTTIRQPMRAIGEEAVHCLFELMAHEGQMHPVGPILLEPTLVVRQSCGAA
jgi:LacI family transcriptional regulator